MSNSVHINGDTQRESVGLVAGNGDLPLEFVSNVIKSGRECIVVANLGEANPQIESLATKIIWVKLGELTRAIRMFTDNGVRKAAFLGGITRVNLFGGVKFDLRAMGMLARLRSVKDDAILRALAAEFEKDGIVVIEPQKFLTDSVPAAGYLTKRRLGRAEIQDARIGWEAADGLGRLDIGQTVIVGHGVVLAVEAVEGTDQCIARGGELGKGGATIVKRCKPQQDLRLDLPTIGPKTIERMVASGCRSLVVEAGRSLVVNRPKVVELADRSKISILAAQSLEEIN